MLWFAPRVRLPMLKVVFPRTCPARACRHAPHLFRARVRAVEINAVWAVFHSLEVMCECNSVNRLAVVEPLFIAGARDLLDACSDVLERIEE
jgi:hypothetical protein